MSFNRSLAFAFAPSVVLATSAGGAWAQNALQQTEASVTDLGGGASALTYWVDRADGRHVVTTVDTVLSDATGRGEVRHAIVRFAAILLPGQTQTVSVPTPDKTQPHELRISRSGDRIDLSLVSSAPDIAQTAGIK
jgi:hypothetical protein